MSKLRLLMICRMAKPEEVIVVEDENGNIVRETMKDNDVLVQYKVCSIVCVSMQTTEGLHCCWTFFFFIIAFFWSFIFYFLFLGSIIVEMRFLYPHYVLNFWNTHKCCLISIIYFKATVNSTLGSFNRSSCLPLFSCIYLNSIIFFNPLICVLSLQIMRETLIYLSHLDHDDTEQQVCWLQITVILFLIDWRC